MLIISSLKELLKCARLHIGFKVLFVANLMYPNAILFTFL